MSRPILVLVGPPGAGKSTVGRLAAERLGLGFRDTDDDVEAVAGKTVPEVFFDDGEGRTHGVERTELVWRGSAGRPARPFPRVEPHFLCREGRVVWQEITDAPIPISGWSRILGHFDEANGG